MGLRGCKRCWNTVRRINFDHLMFFNVHPKQSAQAFMHYKLISTWPRQLGTEPVTLWSAAQQHSHRVTIMGSAVLYLIALVHHVPVSSYADSYLWQACKLSSCKRQALLASDSTKHLAIKNIDTIFFAFAPY